MTTKAVRDYETFSRLVDLWSKENPIKTTKLQVLLAVNGALLSVVHYAGGFTRNNLALFIAGALLSLVWTFSIGRTVLFQKVWQLKLRALARRYPRDPRFQVLETQSTERQVAPWLRVLGGVSSKYYLLFAPAFFAAAWIAGAAYIVLQAG